ncbi:hypothetical protein HYX12_04400 [Candidatus Woesearchaeota archaeon]|nr:hypothetical protein [Candidatus Woesearchaeota archaeon]
MTQELRDNLLQKIETSGVCAFRTERDVPYFSGYTTPFESLGLNAVLTTSDGEIVIPSVFDSFDRMVLGRFQGPLSIGDSQGSHLLLPSRYILLPLDSMDQNPLNLHVCAINQGLMAQQSYSPPVLSYDEVEKHAPLVTAFQTYSPKDRVTKKVIDHLQEYSFEDQTRAVVSHDSLIEKQKRALERLLKFKMVD